MSDMMNDLEDEQDAIRRGIKMILEREPATEFEEIGTVQFVATFKRKHVEVPQTENFGETTQKTTQKILELIVSNPAISRFELATEVGLLKLELLRTASSISWIN
ncbi:MAG: hypothetical protein WA140_11860 [Geobacteraceae bacterium]